MAPATLARPVAVRAARAIAPAEVLEVVRSRSDEYVREQIAKRRGMKSAEREAQQVADRRARAEAAAAALRAS
ncbi:hypothetical protein [Pseudolysinimonas kribbensis]